MKALVDSKDPVLYDGTERWDFKNPPMNSIELANELIEVLIDTGGLGVAAPQIGYAHRVFALRSEEPKVCFNPTITGTGDKIQAMDEGCLSFPQLLIRVKRPVSIRVRYQDAFGDFQTEKMTGLSARCFQHELDHLDGIDFRKRANKYHLERALRQQKKRMKVIKLREKV